jgi:hypothetical protein
MEQQINCTGGRGTQMTFSNGWTISIQFGWGNYCSNRDMPVEDDRYIPYMDKGEKYTIGLRDYIVGNNGSSSAEIAVWHEDRKKPGFGPGKGCDTWVQFGCDSVGGLVPVDAIGAIIGKLAVMSPKATNKQVSNYLCRVINKFREDSE